MAHYTGNSAPFINDHVYSTMILEHLTDNLLPMSWSRNVAEFAKGSVLHIKTLGSVSLQEVAENQSITYSPIESGEITLGMSDYIGDGWYINSSVH